MRSRLFFASCLSLAICGALFAIRSAAADELSLNFAADKNLVGAVLSMGFYGMGWVIAIASPLAPPGPPPARRRGRSRDRSSGRSPS